MRSFSRGTLGVAQCRSISPSTVTEGGQGGQVNSVADHVDGVPFLGFAEDQEAQRQGWLHAGSLQRAQDADGLLGLSAVLLWCRGKGREEV